MNAARPQSEFTGTDMVLVLIFLVGIYLGVAIQLSAHVPIPAAPAGAAGLILLWRRRDRIEPAHLGGLLLVLLLYLCSVVSAESYWFLSKRFTGLIQLTYSLLLGYAIFLTVIIAKREQIAALLFFFCVVILVGCVLEDYGGLRPISDAVRLQIYSYGIYDADFRDMLLYGRIRPRLFTSEPSAVTFGFTLFAFLWFVVARWRWKLLVYLGLIGCSIVVIPGPTLLLGLLLIAPYEMLLTGRGNDNRGSVNVAKIIAATVFSFIMLGAFILLSQTIYAERLNQIIGGNDPSFFYRVIGPALTAFDVVKRHPWAGAGLTGENYIAEQVINVFARSPDFSVTWHIDKVADVLTNYFWLHWIYLGIVWGLAVVSGLTIWLKVLGVPSALFCWLVWAILGQASGAYVSPKTWAVFFLSAAASVLAFQAPVRQDSHEVRASEPRLEIQPVRAIASRS